MTHLSLSDLTSAQVEAVVAVTYEPEDTTFWEALAQGELTPENQALLDATMARLQHYLTQRANEVTLFARAIYPLLMLAEQGSIRAFGGVAVKATIGETELSGVVDAALAHSVLEEPRAPYVLVVEAKRGVRATDPLAQLLGALLCAAVQNRSAGHDAPSFGCYTIADVWTFARAIFSLDDRGVPRMSVTLSRQYTEGSPSEARAIVRVLQNLVSQAIGPAPQTASVLK